jgi:hypothetical protein
MGEMPLLTATSPKRVTGQRVSLVALILLCLLAACADSTWRRDPAVQAAQDACQFPSGMDYACVEQAAVAALNPKICRLAGISIDDMCLQAVYEAAGDPSICDRIYLQGVAPNCRAYYEQFTPAASPPDVATEIPTIAPTSLPSDRLPPTATPTSQPTPSTSPTPLYTLDLSRYDPDIFPPIAISHNPPLIARSDEAVAIVFSFVNSLCIQLPVSCIPQGILYYAYGEDEEYQAISLTIEIVEEMESLVVSLPASDQIERSLRYYAEFSVPEAGYTQRYPGDGTIDLFSARDFIPVELPVENEVEPGDMVYEFFWGYGPDKVRQSAYEGYPRKVGPPAMDVAGDGRIAILDPVNERILIFTPDEGSYSSFPLPFRYANGFFADLAFDPAGRLMVCDYQGEETEGTFGPHPYCYLLHPNGVLAASTPLYVSSPAKMTSDLQILDYTDYKLVAPFNSQGGSTPREAQRHKKTWEFPLRYPEGRDPFVAHYADVKQGLAYEVHSASPLGTLTDFEKTPCGYVMSFFLGDRFRAVWIDPTGFVLKDVSLPNSQYTEINFNGQVAITQDGGLYAISSTERGIEIHYVGAP